MNFIEPLEIDTQFYQGDLIRIHVGAKSHENFLFAMAQMPPVIPNYIAPPYIDILQVAWFVASGKNILIVGKLPSKKMTEFIELLLSFGSWSVCGIDEDEKLHLINADLFRSKGLEYR